VPDAAERAPVTAKSCATLAYPVDSVFVIDADPDTREPVSRSPEKLADEPLTAPAKDPEFAVIAPMTTALPNDADPLTESVLLDNRPVMLAEPAERALVTDAEFSTALPEVVSVPVCMSPETDAVDADRPLTTVAE
jgi:hypothetical protein